MASHYGGGSAGLMSSSFGAPIATPASAIGSNSNDEYSLGFDSSTMAGSPSLAIQTHTPTRVVDLMQQTARGASPGLHSGRTPLSRTSSRGSRDSGLTPPSAADERAAAAAAAEHKIAISVVAIPLDLKSEAPTTPSSATSQLLRKTSGPSASGGTATKNREHLPAPPVLGAVTDAMDQFQLADTDGGATAAGGISLVPFDEDSSPNSGLMHALSNFDEFVLPPERHEPLSTSNTNDDQDDLMFDLDEDQERKAAEADLSPELRPYHVADRDLEEDLDEEDELSELSDEEMASRDRMVPPISSKAAKLLGMMGGDGDGGGSARAASGSTGGPSSTTGSFVPHTIIRPRTASGSGGVNMVPMSLPIAIPSQLRQMMDAQHRGTPKVRESALGRSLKAQAALGSVKQGPASSLAAPRLASSYSSDEEGYGSDPSGADEDEDEDGTGGRVRGQNKGFVPPHTLVEEPFLPRGTIAQSLPRKDRTPVNAHSGMRVIQYGTPDASSSSAAAAASPSSSSSSSSAIALPFANPAPFIAPISSSVPRMAGGLGSARLLAQQQQHQQPQLGTKLGFSAVTAPPPKTGQPRGQLPSSRNPLGK